MLSNSEDSECSDSEDFRWHSQCRGIMVPEGDRAGVMRAFGLNWVPASVLAEYKIGFDYTNRLNLFTRLLDERQRDHRFFDLHSLQWCYLDYVHGHFGDLHIAQTMQGRDVFLLSLLLERNGERLVNVILFLKARWRMKRLRIEAASNLHQAALVCRAAKKVLGHTDLRQYLSRQLLRELVQSRFDQCWNCTEEGPA